MARRDVVSIRRRQKFYCQADIMDEEFYLLVGAMIHESFAKDVEEYEPLSALSFCPRIHLLIPFSTL